MHAEVMRNTIPNFVEYRDPFLPDWLLNLFTNRDLKILLENLYLRPTGHRSVGIATSDVAGECVYSYKGIPMELIRGLFGEKSDEELKRTILWKKHEFGDQQFQQAKRELSRFRQLIQANPQLLYDLNAPIWRPMLVSRSQAKRESGVIVRRIPLLDWRLADSYVSTDNRSTKNKLLQLARNWNLPEIDQVLVKSLNRLCQAFIYFWNAEMSHSNIYWIETTGSIKYARPNSHNIGIDGSVGDYVEEINSLHASREAIAIEFFGAIVNYLLFAEQQNKHFCIRNRYQIITSILQTLSSNPEIINFLSKSGCAREVANQYHNRKKLIQADIAVKNGIEFFSENTYMSCIDKVLCLVDSLIENFLS